MDEISPELPPLFESDPLARDKEDEDEDDEAIARLLEEDLKEDEEDAILPPNLSSRPGSAMGESLSPMPGELDLIEMCRRAAAKLSIDWPSQQEGQGAERDLYDGKRLPSRTSTVKQLIPAVPACVTEMRCFWHKPFSHRVPVKGFLGWTFIIWRSWGCPTHLQSNCRWRVTSTPIDGQPYPPPLSLCQDGQRGCLLLFFKKFTAPLPWLSEL